MHARGEIFNVTLCCKPALVRLAAFWRPITNAVWRFPASGPDGLIDQHYLMGGLRHYEIAGIGLS